MGKMGITEPISMKSVSELFDESFFIPNYQRGYRWEKQQAEDLLNDIDAFIKKVPSEEEIYCLQPLVVSEKGSQYRVIDGQQRLTTIYLILSYLKKTERIYTIEYDTRKDSSDFLKYFADNDKGNIEKRRNENVDFYHMALVYNTIEEWFEKHSKTVDKEDFANVLLNKVKLICYNISKTGSGKVSLDDEIGVFNRLNIGKIPLTDSELIKAMFLNRNNYEKNAEIESRQNKLANEWYEIEKVLQNDEFWLFIHSRYYYRPTRIDYILDLMSRSDAFGILGKIGKDAYDNASDDEKTTMLANIAYRKYKNHDLKLIKKKYIEKIENDLENEIYGLVYENDDNTYTKCGEEIEAFLLKNMRKENREIYRSSKDEGKKDTLKKRFFDKLWYNKEDEFKAEVGEDIFNKCIQPIIDEFSKKLGEKLKDILENEKEKDENENTNKIYTALGEYIVNELTDDEHFIYRYFDKVFKYSKDKSSEELWKKVTDFFKIFTEWYNDYRLYHYIGYLAAVKGINAEDFMGLCVKEWNMKKDRQAFINWLRDEIIEMIKKNSDKDSAYGKKFNYFRDLLDPKKKDVDAEGDSFEEKLINTKFEEEDGYSKRCCVNILLLHNIETVIQYNDKLLNNAKYTAPYFSRFPFHLYNNERWDVEHVMPNANQINIEEERLIYILNAKKYYKNAELNSLIDEYISKVKPKYIRLDYNKLEAKRTELESATDDKKKAEREYYEELRDEDQEGRFKKICEKIEAIGGKALGDDHKNQALGDDHKNKALGDDHKNNIWNYTLLDSSTNREYGNHIFPYKRAYIAKKEEGIKLCIGVVGEKVADGKFQYHLEYRHENKNDIVRMLSAYSKANDLQEMIKEYINGIEDKEQNDIVKMLSAYSKADDLKDKIKEYINGIENNKQRVYENTKGGAKEAKKKIIDGIDDLKDKIKEYINGIENNKQRVYENTTDGAKEAKKKIIDGAKEAKKKFIDGIKGLVDKDLDPNKYMLVYLKSNDKEGRKDNNDIQYKMVETYEEAPFVLQTTKNVFNKYYTEQVTTMLQWTEADAENYWNDMRTKLKYYFDKLDKEMKDNNK